MSGLLVEEYDRFSAMYDILALVNKNTTSESDIATFMQLSFGAVRQLLSFMLGQGFVKTASDSEFRITVLGSNFLQDFQGMRKFFN